MTIMASRTDQPDGRTVDIVVDNSVDPPTIAFSEGMNVLLIASDIGEFTTPDIMTLLQRLGFALNYEERHER
jgi:hypothetical protein